MKPIKIITVVAMVGAMFALSACSSERVIDNTVGAAGYVTKTAAKGVVGAGKLTVKGVKNLAGAS